MRGHNEATASLLDRAADTVAERGLAKGAVLDPFTGAVDVLAALQIAAGTKSSDLTDDIGELLRVVPQANLPAVLEAWTALDTAVDGLEEWQDSATTTTADAVRLLRATSGLFARSSILR